MASGDGPSPPSSRPDSPLSFTDQEQPVHLAPTTQDQSSSNPDNLPPSLTDNPARLSQQLSSAGHSARSSFSAPSPISSVPTPNDQAASSPDEVNGATPDQAASDSHTPMDLDVADASNSPSSSESHKKRKYENDKNYMVKLQQQFGDVRRSSRAKVQATYEESDAEELEEPEYTASDSDSDVVKKPGRKVRKLRKGPVSKVTSKSGTATGTNTPLSDSDPDTYGGQRGRASRKQERARRLKNQNLASANGTPDREFRFSNRQAAKPINYREDDDDDDDLLEDDFELYDPEAWQGVPEDDSPAIDEIMNHRLADETDPEALHPKHFEYLVKWQGKSYYHAAWESYDYLVNLRGAKRLQFYFEKTILTIAQLESRRHDSAEAFEDLEIFLIKQNERLDAYESYKKVDRVIDKRDGDGNTEYLTKWCKQPYDQCTWESDTLISELAQPEIDRYLDNLNRSFASDKVQSNTATRSEWVPFRQQPSYIKNGELRDFQMRGINFIAKNWAQGRSSILADEMGLGKTIQTIGFLAWLRHDRKQQGPFMVCVPLGTLQTWEDTFRLWSPDTHYVVYRGNEKARQLIREKELMEDGDPRRIKFNVLLTTPESVNQDAQWLSQFKWQFLAVDEAHARLKNSKSQLYLKLTSMTIPESLLITGTPIQNNLRELKALVDILEPGQDIIKDDINLESEEGQKEMTGLIENFRPHILRRTKEEVEKDLPQKTEKILRVPLAKIQQELYQNIVLRNYSALNQNGSGQNQSLLNIVMELRKASNHPCLFPNSADQIFAGAESKEARTNALVHTGGKMILLYKLLPKLLAEGHRVLIFSQMVKMLDLIGDFLRGSGIRFQRVDGTIPSGPRQMAIDRFNAADSGESCFILSTRAGGLGINLATADTVILFDSDYNPHNDEQAIARAHRIGQKKFVTVYRLVTADTIEEDIIEKARDKQLLDYVIRQGVTDTGDRAELIDRAKKNTMAPDAKSSVETISKLLNSRGKKIFQPGDNQRELEELDINAVLDNAEEYKSEGSHLKHDGGEEFLKKFEYTDVNLQVDVEWENFVPQERLKQIKDQEEERKREEEWRKLVEENAPRKRKNPHIDQSEPEDRPTKKVKGRKMPTKSKFVPTQDDSEAEEDPSRPLDEKETRNLIRAYERFGSLDDRQEEILRDAKLEHRDIEVIRSTLQEIIQISKEKMKEEKERISNLESQQSKTVTKKDKKAILFDYNGVKKLNAETILQRPREMRILRETLSNVPNVTTFRIPDASKYPSYTCPWGAKEDGMLCVGIDRHGYGAWPAIRDDLELELADKFFLEEHQVAQKKEREEKEDEKNKNIRSPGAVHLVRRANYLLGVMTDRAARDRNTAANSMAGKKRKQSSHHDRQPEDKAHRTSHTTAPSPRIHLSVPDKDEDVTSDKSPRLFNNNVDSKDTMASNSLKPVPISRSSSTRKDSHGGSDRSHSTKEHSQQKLTGKDRRVGASPSPGASGSTQNGVEKSGGHHHRTSSKNLSVHNEKERPRSGSKDKTKAKDHTPRDAFMEGFLGDIYGPLQVLRKNNRDNISPQEKVAVIKTFMKAIKSFVDKNVIRQGNEFEHKFWSYIELHYWPFHLKENSTELLKRTFRKLTSEPKPEVSSAAPVQT